MAIIKTNRLVLRPWKEEDLEPFAQLNADSRVMEYFPSKLSRKESDNLSRRISSKLKEEGWGLWAVSVPDIADFVGFIGLSEPSFHAHFTPAIEVGWRLSYDYWNKGYASEGAKAALKYGFEELNLKEIVSFTAVQNVRSRRVMERIGMHRDPSHGFDPKIPEGHHLRSCILYRLARDEFLTIANSKTPQQPHSK